MFLELVLSVCIASVNPSGADDFECVVFREQLEPRECFLREERYNSNDDKYFRAWVHGLPDAREFNRPVLKNPARCRSLG